MLGLIVGAALLGVIIAVMEEDEFPGWGTMILCTLAALLPMALVNAFLPEALFFVGAIVGASVGGIVISALCGMSVKRACTAAGIWLVLVTGFSLVLQRVL